MCEVIQVTQSRPTRCPGDPAATSSRASPQPGFIRSGASGHPRLLGQWRRQGPTTDPPLLSSWPCAHSSSANLTGPAPPCSAGAGTRHRSAAAGRRRHGQSPKEDVRGAKRHSPGDRHLNRGCPARVDERRARALGCGRSAAAPALPAWRGGAEGAPEGAADPLGTGVQSVFSLATERIPGVRGAGLRRPDVHSLGLGCRFRAEEACPPAAAAFVCSSPSIPL